MFKPDNVLVDRDGVAKVADFGLARPSEEGSGQVAGTPGYMSPEQFLGEATDARSDVFSFAVALHRALYGAPPYAGATVEALRASVAAGVITPPPRLVGPPRLRLTLYRGLARRPEDRYPTMDEFLAELRRFTPAGARRRGPLVAGAAGLGLAGVALVALVGGRPGPSPADVAAIAGEVFVAGQSAQAAEWVYPADEASAARTAIRRIVDLERVQGPAAELARRHADDLRERFAGELAGLGAHYWDDERTRAFARDFYAQTLMFQPDHEVALSRGRLTAGQLADLRARAEASAFSDEQLAAAAPLRALADVDHVDVAAVLAGLQCGCTGGQDRGAAAAAAPPPPEPEAIAAAAAETDAEAAAEADAEADAGAATSTGEAADEPAATDASPPPPTRPGAPARAAAGEARALLEQAKGARRDGQDGEATRLFSQVLVLDPDNDTALGALSDLAFDRGDYQEAAALAERAALAAPTVARHHIQRGDAAFKLGRLADARASYEQAVALGDTRGARRLELLKGATP